MPNGLVSRVPDVESSDLTLGQAIAIVRRPTGMSARALSMNAGLSESYVGKVEKGEIDPSLRAFSCIVRSLGLSMLEIHLLVMRAGVSEHKSAEV